MFKNCELSIAVDINLKTVVYLDMTFNFEKNLYKRYRKPNNSLIYINKNSNHPPNILKHLLKSIAKCVSKTLSSEQIFNRPTKIYCKALRKDDLKYSPNEAQQIENNEERKCKRKIIWFNSHYSKNVKTNVGKVFLKLVKKLFRVSHILQKIFNKNTVYYSCMKNTNVVWVSLLEQRKLGLKMESV